MTKKAILALLKYLQKFHKDTPFLNTLFSKKNLEHLLCQIKKIKKSSPMYKIQQAI